MSRSHAGRSFQETFVDLVKGGSRPKPRTVFYALRDVSFTLEKGKAFGLIGANGAGKSTALKLMTQIIEPSSGQLHVDGRVGALLELGAGFHPDLTGRENVYLNGAILGLDRDYMRRQFDKIVAFAELEDFIDLPVKHYSSGMYVRLGFAVAVHSDPEILLVDEVLAVGDASFANKCLSRIAQLRRAGVTIVLVSHAISTVQSLCDEAIWFDQGELIAQGGSTDVVMAYLRHVADQENAKAQQTARSLGMGERYIPERTVDAAIGSGRWGTGRVRVDGVDICDGDGAPKTSFLTGESLEIRIHYDAQERVERPVFGLAIHHQNGTHVTGPNTRFAGLNIPFVLGRGVVTYRLPALWLLDGTYAVSVSVHEYSDLEMYDYHDRLYTFRVYPGPNLEQYGIVALNGKWSLSSGETCPT